MTSIGAVDLDLGPRPGDAADDSHWSLSGLCRQADPDLFFPEKGGSTRNAKQICAKCPVRRQCLEYAMATDQPFGVWGGLSEGERRRLRNPGRGEPAAAA